MTFPRLTLSSRFFLLPVFCAIVACGPSTPASERPRHEPQSARDVAPTPANASTTEISPPPLQTATATSAGPRVRGLFKTPLTGPPPSLEIARPREDQLIRRGPVMVDLTLTDFQLASAPGNHVHLRVDDREELAAYDASRPISLSDLYEEKFGEPLAAGTHVLRAFLSRSNHESVKMASAFSMVVFHVGARSTDFPALDRSAPMMTYSRPQGCAADSSRLLDFMITNLNDLSRDGYRVRYEIDGVEGFLTSWQPYRIDNLGTGEHVIRLTLLDPSGEPAPGPYNDTTRTISGRQSCPSLGLIPDSIADEDDEEL